MPKLKVVRKLPVIVLSVPDRFERPYGVGITVDLIGRPWPKLHITPTACGKMWALTQLCDIEIGWLSSCRMEKENFIIDDVFVPHQVCTIVSTDITPDGEETLLTELIRTGQKEVINSLCCWGHSHVDMDARASSPDEKQTLSFVRRITKRHGSHFVRVIANQKGDLTSAIYLLDMGIVVYNSIIVSSPPDVAKWKSWAESEIESKVVRDQLNISDGPIWLDLKESVIDPASLEKWLIRGYISRETYDDLYDLFLEAEKKSNKEKKK